MVFCGVNLEWKQIYVSVGWQAVWLSLLVFIFAVKDSTAHPNWAPTRHQANVEVADSPSLQARLIPIPRPPGTPNLHPRAPETPYLRLPTRFFHIW